MRERIVELRERALGTNHLDTARAWYNLGEAAQGVNDPARSKIAHEKALRIREQLLGPEHRDTVNSLQELDEALAGAAENAQARGLLERALKMRLKILGPAHPDTAKTQLELGNVFVSLGETNKGEAMRQEALLTFNKEKPKTEEERLEAQDTPLWNAGRYTELIELRKKVYQLRRRKFGAAHVQTGFAAESLALIYNTVGNYAMAESNHLHALDIVTRALSSSVLRGPFLVGTRASKNFKQSWG